MSGAARRPASRRTVVSLSLGHAAADLCSGALIALLPFLRAERHYSYAAAGVFALTASLASAAFQPLAGQHGDRGEAHWLLPLGLVLAGLGIGAVGFTTSYPLTLLAVVLCTAGVATYHPEGARWARHAAGNRVTTDMSIFSVGGGVGYALGPLAVAAVLAPLGLHGTPVIALIPFGVALLVAVALRRFREQPVQERPRTEQPPPAAPEWAAFAVLAALFSLASGVSTGLLTFVPLFLLQRNGSPAASNVMTSVLLAAAAGGTLLGGVLAARFGRRPVLVLPQLVLAPAIALLPSLGYGAMIPVMIVIGLSLNANVSIALVLAQEYLPARMGLAAGVVIGVCGGIGGLIVAALGVLGDAVGLGSVIYTLAALPLVVAVLAARLPRPAAAPPGTVWNLRIEAES